MSNRAKWRNYDRQTLEQIVKESFSMREVARKLGYAQDGGGTIQSLKNMCQELNLDISHFKGKGWNKSNYKYDSFQPYSSKSRGKTTQNALIALRGRKCEHCGLTQWLEQPINLQIHHIDGDHTNNSLDNLQLLCPNCHSYTPNFCKNINQKRYVSDEEFVTSLRGSKSIRQALLFLDLKITGSNYERARHLIEIYDIQHLKEKEHQNEKSSE